MYRTIDTSVWDDPWFAELEPDAKLFFLYLITNRRTNASGAYELTERQMMFETGLSADGIHTVLIALAERIRWYPGERIIWVRNFYRYQCVNEKMRTSARTHVAGLPASVRQEIGKTYPELVPDEDRVSKRSRNGISSNSNKEKQREEVTVTQPRAAEDGYPPEFETFWQRYPRKEPSKKEAARSWVRVSADANVVMAGLERWIPVWAARGDPEKIPHATTWLNQERWTVEAPARASPNGHHSTAGKSFSELAREADERDESRRNGQGAGPHPRALLADAQSGRERPGHDAGNVDAGVGRRAIDAVHRERP